MATLEITLQRKIDNDWPVIGVFSRTGDFLPVRTESRLELDIHSLLPYANPKDYGIALGKALFREDLRDALTRAQAQAREDQQPLRILLNVEADDLKPIHWERLSAPLDGVWDFFCLNQSTPFSLYLPSLTDRRFPPIGRRNLRALVLIAGPEELEGDFGLAPFDIPATIASLRQSFESIPNDILAAVDGALGPPTLESLCEHLTSGSYSLLHIECHGRQSPNGDTILFLPDSQRRPVTATEFIERITRLQGIRSLPHFTFLMTCESASPEAENGFGGFGQRLVRELGMPAVLAMTAPISIQTGSELATRFYIRLRDHGEVDRALSEALAGLMGRPDVTVPAIFSRLGGRPLFSDALDRPLTANEIQFGLEILGKLVSERAPVLQDEYKHLLSTLHAPAAELETLSAGARQEYTAALESANVLSDEIADLSFNALALGRPIPPYDQRCPFRGLASFRPEDRPFFFGREALVKILLERLDAYPFLAVLGPSGSGKSSLVLAGLIPALAQRTPGRSEESSFAYLTPGADPLPRLEAALVSAPDCSLVVIDQFEELFTLCRDERKRGEFIQRILTLRTNQRVVLTMRADFWGECAPYTALKDEMQAHQELVAPLVPADLRGAIEQQAAAVRLRFEADLAEDILDDVEGEPGAMPLLQHALLLLWERRHGRWLRSAEYRSFGGVNQAIAHTADGIYLELGQLEQLGMRNIFVRLTRLDEDPAAGIERRDTRRRVPLDELVPAGSERRVTVELINRLADARLVVTGVDPANSQEEVEVAHEALIRYWKRLQNWLEEDRSVLRQGERVREAAQQWQEIQRDESLLVHRGGRLEEALELVDRKAYPFNQREIEYLTACRELRQREQRARERRRTQWLAAAVFAAVIFALLAGFGLIQSNLATHQAATATSALGLSQQRGTEVANQASTAQAASMLAVQQQKTAEFNAQVALDNERKAERQAAIARSGELAAQAQSASTIFAQRSLLLAAETLRQVNPSGEDAPVRALQVAYDLLQSTGGRNPFTSTVDLPMFSPGGSWLALFDTEKIATQVWDQRQPGREPMLLGLSEGCGIAHSFSPDDRWLLTYSDVEGITTGCLWMLSTNLTKADCLFQAEMGGPIFSPDGRWFAYSTWPDPGVALLDLKSLGSDIDTQPIVLENPLEKGGYPDGLWKFSPSGRWLVTSNANETLLWDMSKTGAGEQFQPLILNASPYSTVSISQDERWLAIDNDAGRVLVIDLQEPSSTFQEILLPEKDVKILGFQPDRPILLTYDLNNKVYFSDVQHPANPPEVLESPEPNGDWAFIPSRFLLITSGASNNYVWDLLNRWTLATSSFGPFSEFSPKGNWIVDFNPSSGNVGDLSLLKVDELQQDISTAQIVLQRAPIRLHGQDATVKHAVFSPDEKRLVVTSEDGSGRVFDLENPYALPLSYSGSAPNWHTSGNKLWLARIIEDNRIEIWRADELTSDPIGEPTLIDTTVDQVKDLAISDNGRWIAVDSSEGPISLWDTKDRQASSISLPDSNDRYWIIFFVPGDRWLAARNELGLITTWDIQNPGNPPVSLPKSENDVYSLTFSRDGKWLAGNSYDSQLQETYLWNLEKPARAPIIFSRSRTPSSVAISSDGRWLVMAGKEAGIQFIDLANLKADPVILGEDIGRIVGAHFSPDGRWLSAWSLKKGAPTSLLWNMEHFPTELPAARPIPGTIAYFSPDNRWYANGTQLWKLDNLGDTPTISLNIPDTEIRGMQFSPKSRWLAMAGVEEFAGGGSELILWDLDRASSGQESHPLILRDSIMGNSNINMWFSEDENWVFASDGPNLHIWPLDPARLISLLCETAGRNLSQVEWGQYFPGDDYQSACSQ